MKDQGESFYALCPCVQTKCVIRGNCVICVRGHLKLRNHIPECFQEMLLDQIRSLAGLIELGAWETRQRGASAGGAGKDKPLRKSARRSAAKGRSAARRTKAASKRRGAAGGVQRRGR